MAKKTVATLQTGSKKLTKAIKMIRGKSMLMYFLKRSYLLTMSTTGCQKNKYFTFVTG